MKRFWTGIIAASFVATVGLAAQEPAPGSQSAPAAPGAQGGATTSQAPAAAGAQKVTLTGCIQNAPAASASATSGAQAGAGAGAAAGGAAAEGARASASAGQNFILADAKMASSAGAGSSTSAVGTSGTSATRYELDGDSKTISSHLNHQVEITGTVQSSSASATGAANSAPGSRAASPRLKVDSVKMVAATCS
jgi:hypothetical protein